MQLVVYTNEDLKNNGGSFAVLVPTGALSLEATISKDVPAGSKYKVVNLENPAEKVEMEKITQSINAAVSYWSAWEGNFDDLSSPMSFTINLEKAKTCHIQYVRAYRDLELPKLDIDYQRADETGDLSLKATIAAKKQKLRDMPSDTRIVNCSDFDTLKTLTYEYLRDN